MLTKTSNGEACLNSKLVLWSKDALMLLRATTTKMPTGTTAPAKKMTSVEFVAAQV